MFFSFSEVHSSNRKWESCALEVIHLFGLMSRPCYNRASLTGSVLAGAFLKRKNTSCLFIMKSKTQYAVFFIMQFDCTKSSYFLQVNYDTFILILVTYSNLVRGALSQVTSDCPPFPVLLSDWSFGMLPLGFSSPFMVLLKKTHTQFSDGRIIHSNHSHLNLWTLRKC